MPGYRPWRPLWFLAACWPLWLGHVALELAHAHRWLWLVDLPLLALGLLWLARTWPRGPAPPLLRVLFLGYAWLPLAMALYALQSAWFFATGEFVLGRAPVHAVSVGFFGSLLVAMVTRVTQGHSGRPLVLGRIPALAFIGMQGVAAMRVLSELAANPAPWFLAAGAHGHGLWIGAFSDVPLAGSVRAGEVDPIEGWVSTSYGRRRPAPVVVYRASGRFPIRIVTLLWPVKSIDGVPAVDVRRARQDFTVEILTYGDTVTIDGNSIGVISRTRAL